MNDRSFDLLRERLIRVSSGAGSATDRTLPEVLAELCGEGEPEFPNVRTHQAYPWYAFLVQMAALALGPSPGEAPPRDPDSWAKLLLRLTGDDPAPWCMVVGDLSKPAFMQSPVPEGTLDGYKSIGSQPDWLDVLVTSKNHDVKATKMSNPRPEHWLMSLMTLQTIEGFLGRGNYGIVRMNGGFASRPFVGFAPGAGWGSRFRRDLLVLREHETTLREKHEYARQGGKSLLWLEPWDGATSLGLRDCHPYFIEICRRVRLTFTDGRLRAAITPTTAQRVSAKESKGNTGDPWTPVQRDEAKALNVGHGGFGYDLLRKLVLGNEYEPGAALRMRSSDGKGVLFVGAALARKQGGTEGFHERHVEVPARVCSLLGRSEERDRLGRLAQSRVETVSTCLKSVLRPALCALLQGGPERLNFKDARTKRWEQALDRSIDSCFFEQLWADAESTAEDAEQHWASLVVQLARVQLEAATHAAPIPAMRKYRAVSRAEGLFFGAARKHLSAAFPKKEGTK